MSAALGLAGKVLHIDRALTRARIPHAFGGALALAYYATPRATIDIDVNVFLPSERFADVAEVLRRAGATRFPSEQAVVRLGQMRAWWGDTPVDVFFSYDPVHEAMREGARKVPFGRARIPILSPEHLMVAKAAFNRPKDWIDIEQMLVAVDDLDLDEVRHWLGHLVGERDSRMVRLDELVTAFRGSG